MCGADCESVGGVFGTTRPSFMIKLEELLGDSYADVNC